MNSADGGVSLLKHPSAAMGKLISSVDRSKGVQGNGERALQRPVMEFIVQRHDLDGLQLAMKQALRKAACRVFAMQVGSVRQMAVDCVLKETPGQEAIQALSLGMD